MTSIRENYPLVKTEQGLLRGIDLGRVLVFRGIAYASAARFGAPEEPEPWDGIRDAYVWGSVCLTSGENRSTLYTTNRLWNKGEDCLNLNISTPALGPEQKKPVMVWIHGGGFSGGSAIAELTTDSENLAATGKVVVVSVNHRLGCLGFLDLRDFGGAFSQSANAGMLDLVMALRWIRRNIEAFGGDPERVTLFGQSGGGGKIMALMQMPSADGLFQRAIIQSGVMKIQPSWRSDVSRVFGRKVAEKLGLDERSIERIRSVPFEQLAAAVASAKAEMDPRADFFGPHPDGETVFDDYSVAGFRPESTKIPVLAGSCLGELAMFDPRGVRSAPFSKTDLETLSQAEKLERLQQRFGKDADAIADEMRVCYPWLDPLFALNVDCILRPTVLDYVRARCRAAEAPTYNYILSYLIPALEGKLPWHGSDLGFCFGNVEKSEVLQTGGASAERVMRAMMAAWISFAASGDPAAPELPEWKPFTAVTENCMLFDDPCRLSPGLDQKLQQLLCAHTVSMFH